MERNHEIKRILIVDDEPNVVAILAEGLKKLGDGYIIDTASNGSEAAAQIQQHNYAIVITDYKMPGMSGIKLAYYIRQQSPDTQVVLMTAYGTSALRDVVGSLKLDGYLDKPVSINHIREIVKRAVGQTSQGEDPYRSGKHTLPQPVYKHLQELQTDTNARCVLLLSAGGHPIEMVGVTGNLDIASISALVAANFMAAVELAKLLGNDSVFKSSYHEGPDYDIYAYDVNGESLLAVIFGTESKTGIVRFYANKTIKELAPLLAVEPPAGKVADDLSTAIDAELDQLFSVSDS